MPADPSEVIVVVHTAPDREGRVTLTAHWRGYNPNVPDLDYRAQVSVTTLSKELAYWASEGKRVRVIDERCKPHIQAYPPSLPPGRRHPVTAPYVSEDGGQDHCGWRIAWHGRCRTPVSAPGERCNQHVGKTCAGCDQPATGECGFASQFVCGFPLCDNCDHHPSGYGHGPRLKEVGSCAVNGGSGGNQQRPDEQPMTSQCSTCNDTGHVCEDHPTMAWGGMCCGPQPRRRPLRARRLPLWWCWRALPHLLRPHPRRWMPLHS